MQFFPSSFFVILIILNFLLRLVPSYYRMVVAALSIKPSSNNPQKQKTKRTVFFISFWGEESSQYHPGNHLLFSLAKIVPLCSALDLSKKGGTTVSMETYSLILLVFVLSETMLPNVFYSLLWKTSHLNLAFTCFIHSTSNQKDLLQLNKSRKEKKRLTPWSYRQELHLHWTQDRKRWAPDKNLGSAMRTRLAREWLWGSRELR